MDEQYSWEAFYSGAARDYDESAIGHSHMAEVVGAAAQKFGTRPAVSTQLPSGACATLNFREIDRLTDDFAGYLREVAGLQPGDTILAINDTAVDHYIGDMDTSIVANIITSEGDQINFTVQRPGIAKPIIITPNSISVAFNDCL